MAAANEPHKRWHLSHDPEQRPLGCNGKYGGSGMVAHRKKGEKGCMKCKASSRHYQREYRRGGIRPRQLKGCGTRAAAERHRAKDEELDFACRLAEAEYHQELRDKADAGA